MTRSDELKEDTALGRLTVFANETNSYMIRAEQLRPDVRELLALIRSNDEPTEAKDREQYVALVIEQELHRLLGIIDFDATQIARAAIKAMSAIKDRGVVP